MRISDWSSDVCSSDLMAVDLKAHNVATASIWMGMLRTDRTRRVMDAEPEKYAGFWEIAETPEFTGHVIGALYRDEKRAEKSGQVLIGAELAQEYRSEEHTSELQSLMRISYAVFCLKKKKHHKHCTNTHNDTD